MAALTHLHTSSDAIHSGENAVPGIAAKALDMFLSANTWNRYAGGSFRAFGLCSNIEPIV